MNAAITTAPQDTLSRIQALFAATLWAEASSRPVRAMEALAALACNRARAAAACETARLRYAAGAPAVAAASWALLLPRVCQAPFLFGCWNRRDARHALLAGQDDPARAIATRIAARAASGTLPDPTGGATHWHDAAALPGWALGHVPVATLAGLVLYRLDA